MEHTDYLNDKIIVRTPSIDDFERIRSICDGRFGEGYLQFEEFKKWIRDADYCKIAVADGVIAGIVYLMPESIPNLAKALHLDEDYVRSVSGGKKVIHSRCAALDKKYEHRGIINLIHEEIFDNIEANGFGAVFAPAWTYNGYTPMAKLLTRYGFEYIGEKENLWSGYKEYKCIICGGPCKCKAAIYQKRY